MNQSKIVLVITGCTGKLARCFARLYQDEFDIIGISRSTDEVPGMRVIRGNINNDINQIVKQLKVMTNRVDVLVNNAFYIAHQRTDLTNTQEMMGHFETNVVAPVALTNAILNAFWKETAISGTAYPRQVINVSSVSGIYDYFGGGHGFYSASKAALNTITRFQANELKSHGVYVNALAPCTFPRVISTESVAKVLRELTSADYSGTIRVMNVKYNVKNEETIKVEGVSLNNHYLKNAPFKHVLIHDFLPKDTYESFCHIFNSILARGLSDSGNHGQFALFSTYDAYFWMIPPEIKAPLSMLYTQEWKQYFSDMFDIPLTDDVVAEFHHHQPGSKNGTPHNDYNLCCFTDERLPNGINPWYFHCNYRPERNDMTTGKIYSRMRSIAILYYMNNPEWKEGDGGETALYYTDKQLERAVLVPPVNNTLLAFEITPHSYHSFRRNVYHDRNTMIMWLHSNTEAKIARHGQIPPI